MTGLVKSVGKAIKKVVSGVKKVFKKIASSKIGKVLLIAAAVYLGGAALSMWSVPGGVPFAANINGAFTAAGSQAAQVAAANKAVAAGSFGTSSGVAAATSAPTLASNVAAGSVEKAVASGAFGTPTAGTVAGGTATGTAAAANAPITPPSPSGIEAGMQSQGAGYGAGGQAGAGVTENASRNIVAEMMKNTGDILAKPFETGNLFGKGGWISQNQTTALMGGSMIAGAFTPDSIDVAREQQTLQQEQDDADQERRRQNFLGIGGIDVGRPNDTKLRKRGGGLLYGGIDNGIT
jgi:hypothetical protein